MELNRKIFMGVVEDNKDPNRKGRIKVRVQTLYNCIPLEDIPYASPFAGLAGKRFEVPAIGKIVNVLFLNDDLYSPLYIYSENNNINLQNKLNSLTDEEYIDFISLLFDEKTQIYVKGQELTIDMLLNKITITNNKLNAVNLELKDNKQILNLGSRNSDQDAVLGTNFFEWMDKFIDELSNPTSLIGNAGAPILKPLLQTLCMEYKLKRPTFVSNNVKIVDNGKVNILKRRPDTDNKKHDFDLIIPDEECNEYENIPGTETIQQQLEKKIKDQSQKSCEELDGAAATDEVPYREHPSENSNLELTSDEMKKVWSTDAQNKIDKLHPEFRPYVTKFLNLCEAQGILIIITSGYRSIQEQINLQSTGNAAQPGYSYHNYGLAIDIDLKDSNEWNKVGAIGESIGLRWGIRFTNPKPEKWHFDGKYIFNLEAKELKKRYDNDNIVNGYVNLGTDKNIISQDIFKGQKYSTPEKQVCDNSNFNRKNSKDSKSNINGSDEREEAPSTELGNEKISKPFDCEETDLSTSTKLEPNKKLSKEDFVKLLYPYALESERKTGVPALVTLSQAAWESGWGKSSPGNMYFGIKAQTNYTGQKQLITTTEILKNPNITYPEIISITPVTINGNQYYKYKVKDYFRKYNTPEESFTDHGKFFIENNRYKNAMLVKNDPYAFIDEVSKAGYATDPNYASNLKSITRDMENILGRLCV